MVFKFSIFKVIMFTFFIFYSQSAKASFERNFQSTLVKGRGLSGIASSQYEFVLLNPATIAQLQQSSISLSYTPSIFEIPELSSTTIISAIPTEYGNIGASFTTNGISLYREMIGTLTYAKNFDGQYNVGVNINLQNLTIKNYGSTSVIGIDIGGSVNIVENVRTGFSILNINRPTLGKIKDELPQVYSAGIEYMFASSALISLDMVKDVRYPLALRIGTDFSPHEIITVRFGMHNQPFKIHMQTSSYYGGISIHYEFINFNYAVEMRNELGITHSLGFSFSL